MPVTATTRERPVLSEPWNGDNLTAIRVLLEGTGDASVNPDGTLDVTSAADTERRTAQLGQWVTRFTDGEQEVVVQGQVAYEAFCGAVI